MISINRGDVLLADMPFIDDRSQQKLRPVLVVQNDVGNRFSPNTIVLAISSSIRPRVYPTHYHIKASTLEGKNAGLTKDSIVKAEMILTISKSSVQKKLGVLPAVTMDEIDKRLRVSLALS